MPSLLGYEGKSGMFVLGRALNTGLADSASAILSTPCPFPVQASTQLSQGQLASFWSQLDRA